MCTMAIVIHGCWGVANKILPVPTRQATFSFREELAVIIITRVKNSDFGPLDALVSPVKSKYFSIEV